MSCFIQRESFAEAFAELLAIAMGKPDAICRPRGMEVRELIAPTIRVLNPLDRWYKSEARSTPMRYAAGEFLWYFGLRNDVEFITKYSAFWNQIKNQSSAGPIQEGRVNSSYGQLVMSNDWRDAGWGSLFVSQWEWALGSVVKDVDTRQSIVHVARPAHQLDWIKDFPCTLTFQFLVRDGRTNMVVNMRSNDLIMGLTFDLPMFTIFQEQFVHDLRQRGVDTELGHITLMSGSSHVYERNYETVRAMLEGGISSDGPVAPCTPPMTRSTGEIAWHQHFTALTKWAEGDLKALDGITLDPVYFRFSEATMPHFGESQKCT